MAKWADRLIHSVRFNTAHTHIDRVRYRLDDGDSVGTQDFEATRQQVITDLRSGITYLTVTPGDNGWKPGAKVGIVAVDGTDFIKTKADKSKADNLDNLREF